LETNHQAIKVRYIWGTLQFLASGTNLYDDRRTNNIAVNLLHLRKIACI